MKKLVALLCATVMTVATCVTPFAAISGRQPATVQDLHLTVTIDITSTATDAVVASEVDNAAQLGHSITLEPTNREDVTVGSTADKVLDVFASSDGNTAKVLEAAGVTGDTITTTTGNTYSKDKLVVESEMMSLKYDNGTSLASGKVHASFPVPQSLQGKTKLVIMQVDPQGNEMPVFVDVKIENGNIVVDLPHADWPFVIMEVKD